MDNSLSKGLLLTVAVTLVAYGIQIIQANPLYGIISMVLGVTIFVAREVLKKYGYDVGLMFYEDKKPAGRPRKKK